MNLEKFSYDNQIVKLFIIATVVWGIVGMTVGLLIAFQIYLPWLLGRWISILGIPSLLAPLDRRPELAWWSSLDSQCRPVHPSEPRWSQGPSGPWSVCRWEQLLHLHVRSAKERIIQRPRINGRHRISSSWRNTVHSAGSIFCIKRQNNSVLSCPAGAHKTGWSLVSLVIGMQASSIIG